MDTIIIDGKVGQDFKRLNITRIFTIKSFFLKVNSHPTITMNINKTHFFMVLVRCLMMGYRFFPFDSHSFVHFSA